MPHPPRQRRQEASAETLEDKVLLQILRRAPVAVWAARGRDGDFAVRYWGPGAESIYGYLKEDMIGTNFIQKFVDPHEREQAEQDIDLLISEGREFSDFRASDIVAGGGNRELVVWTFPIWDEGLGETLAAEVGVDITDLEKNEQVLRAIREDKIEADALLARMKIIGRLRETAASISSYTPEDDVQETLAKIISSVIELVGDSWSANVWIVQDGVASWAGSSDGAEPSDKDPLINWVIENGDPVYHDVGPLIASTVALPKVSRRISRHPFVIMPLKAAPDVVGALHVQAKGSAALTDELVDGLALLAENAALAIRTASLVASVTYQTKVIERQRLEQARLTLRNDASRVFAMTAPISSFCSLIREELQAGGELALARADEHLRELEQISLDVANMLQSFDDEVHESAFSLSDVLDEVFRQARQIPGVKAQIQGDTARNVLIRAVRPTVVSSISTILVAAVEAAEDPKLVEGRLEISPREQCVLVISHSGPSRSSFDGHVSYEAGASITGPGWPSAATSSACTILAAYGGDVRYRASQFRITFSVAARPLTT